MPLLRLDIQDPPAYVRQAEPLSSPGEYDETPAKRWWHYIPLCSTIVLMFAPHPSILITLTTYYLRIRNQPFWFTFHLSMIYSFTFLAFCSLIVCVARDPGAVYSPQKSAHDDESGMSLTQALMATPEDHGDGEAGEGWCRKCWAPKPERTHHCSLCGRCVLKMDHHCPWLGAKCIGHWTYPAFIHFLLMITLLSMYVMVLGGNILWIAFLDPFLINESTAVNALFLAVMGAVFALCVGSFLCWHLYLVTTNQTTLESLSPFLLLRLLPAPPVPPSAEADDPLHPTNPAAIRRRLWPPEEHELSSSQRRLIRHAQYYIRVYDLGWKRNWWQVIGWTKPYGWAWRLLYGGGGSGDGRRFPRHPRVGKMLQELSEKLVAEDKL